MYELISGPLVWASFAVFFIGLAVQGVRFFKLTRARGKLMPPKTAIAATPRPPRPKPAGPFVKLWGPFARFSPYYDAVVRFLRRSVAGTHPVMTIVTVVFHVLLIATPLFVLAHNTLIRGSVIGFALPSLPEHFADFLTFVVIVCLGIFLFRRIFLRRVRIISSSYDFFVLFVTAAPFVTGFVAYHQWLDYRTVLIAHIIAGEAMLVLVPFTRLGHALFFFLYRIFVPSEYSFGRGRRAWRGAGPQA